MRRREIGLRLALHRTTAERVIRTVEDFGCTRVEGSATWFFPSVVDGRVRIELTVASAESAQQLRLGMTIRQFLFDVDSSFENTWSESLSQRLGISLPAASALVVEASVWVEMVTSDPEALLTVVPVLVRELLIAHDGVAVADSVWTSQEIRSGRLVTLPKWPFPSLIEEFESCDAVVVGKCVARMESQKPTTFVLTVEEVLRGNVPRSIDVDAASLPMVVGKRYLLFLRRVEGRFTVDHRGNSEALPVAAESLGAARQKAAQHRHGPL